MKIPEMIDFLETNVYREKSLQQTNHFHTHPTNSYYTNFYKTIDTNVYYLLLKNGVERMCFMHLRSECKQLSCSCRWLDLYFTR
jgi:hypothetical protein